MALLILSSMVIVCSAGCISTAHKHPVVHASLPKEMAKTTPFLEYDIGISDVLIVESVRMVPKPPYYLQSSDGIGISDYGLDDEEFRIAGQYRIQPGGTIILPLPIGAINVAGLTCEDAGEVIAQKVAKELGLTNTSDIGVTVELLYPSGLQPVSGQHVVGPDGRIILGIYGSVHVAGLTLTEAKEAIEFQLAKKLEDPEVAVDIYSYNTKRYYVVMQGAGFGDKIGKFSFTGNETVLDAISDINGMDRVSSKRVWIARPSPMNDNVADILIVDWQGITANASWQTNYQLMDGDRIFIEEDKLVAFDTKLSKFTAPLERIMGFALLGAQTTTRFSGDVLQGGGDRMGRGGY